LDNYDNISISSKILPDGGTATFALLALAGDLGGSVGPAIIGNVSQRAGENLQAGMLAGIGFPIMLVICVLVIQKNINPVKAIYHLREATMPSWAKRAGSRYRVILIAGTYRNST